MKWIYLTVAIISTIIIFSDIHGMTQEIARDTLAFVAINQVIWLMRKSVQQIAKSREVYDIYFHRD